MAGLLEKISQLWNVPDDEYEEFEEEEEEVVEEVSQVKRRPSFIRETKKEEKETASRDIRSSSRDINYFEAYGQNSFARESRQVRREIPMQEAPVSKVNNNKVVNINATTQLQVVVFRPDRFGEETRSIADELLKMHTVVLNLENTDKDQARRIVDFLSGLAYSNGGKIKRIATDTFIVTPYNVDLMGDNVLDELENSGVYF